MRMSWPIVSKAADRSSWTRMTSFFPEKNKDSKMLLHEASARRKFAGAT